MIMVNHPMLEHNPLAEALKKFEENKKSDGGAKHLSGKLKSKKKAKRKIASASRKGNRG